MSENCVQVCPGLNQQAGETMHFPKEVWYHCQRVWMLYHIHTCSSGSPTYIGRRAGGAIRRLGFRNSSQSPSIRLAVDCAVATHSSMVWVPFRNTLLLLCSRCIRRDIDRSRLLAYRILHGANNLDCSCLNQYGRHHCQTVQRSLQQELEGRIQ